jgi:hypothetical protein
MPSNEHVRIQSYTVHLIVAPSHILKAPHNITEISKVRSPTIRSKQSFSPQANEN